MEKKKLHVKLYISSLKNSLSHFFKCWIIRKKIYSSLGICGALVPGSPLHTHPPTTLPQPYHFPGHYFPLILSFSFSRYLRPLKGLWSSNPGLTPFRFFFLILSHYFPSETFSDFFLQREKEFCCFVCFLNY